MRRPSLDAVRGFDNAVYVIAAGQLVNVFGSGLVYPFATVHFHLQVGIGLAVVGLGLGLNNGATALGTAVGGVVADRVGRKPVMVASMAASAVTLAAFAFVPLLGTTLPAGLAATLGLAPGGLAFLLVAAAAGFTSGLYAPAGQAMTADLTDGDRRDQAYALLKVANNVGFGAGFVAGGVLYAVVNVAVFVGDGLTSGLFALLLFAFVPRTTDESDTPTDDSNTLIDESDTPTDDSNTLIDESDTPTDASGTVTDTSETVTDSNTAGVASMDEPGRRRGQTDTDGETENSRPAWERASRRLSGVVTDVRQGTVDWWGAVSRPRVVTLALVNVGFAVMYAQMQTTVPIVATERLGLSSEQLGTLYVLNPLTLVVLQLPVVDWVSNWRRTRGLVLAAGFWAVSMLAAWGADAGVAAVVGLPLLGVALVATHLVVRTVGEILHSPLATALMSDLGSPDERGTQLSLLEIAKRLGMGLGSFVGGWFFDAGLSLALWPTLVVGCLLVALGVLGLERRLSSAENAVSGDATTPAD